MPKIRLDNFNLGGTADSKYQGVPYSQAAIVGFDLHSEPGILKSAQKLTKESGATIDEFVKVILPCSDGNTYLFSSTSGKVWKRTSAGVYSLITTVAPAAGSAAVSDAEEKDGYILYAMANRLGRVAVPSSGDVNWAVKDDNWATFTNGYTIHPIQKLNLLAYIGDKNLVAQVNESNVFSAAALDLEELYKVTTLSKFIRKLMIGTKVGDNVQEAPIFRWNTWSTSFQSPDDVPEVGINAWQEVDNGLLAHAGLKGNIYQYNGEELIHLKRILGDWTGTKKAIVYLNAVGTFKAIPIFGLSNNDGNPANQGVYSFGSAGNNYPRVLDLTYPISQGALSNVEIGAIAPISADQFLVSWKDSNPVPTVYGVDILDLSNKYSGSYIETRILGMERGTRKDFHVEVFYRSLPANTDIVISGSSNYGAYSTVTSQNNTQDMKKEATVKMVDAAAGQIKIATTASGNNAPEIEAVEISWD